MGEEELQKLLEALDSRMQPKFDKIHGDLSEIREQVDQLKQDNERLHKDMRKQAEHNDSERLTRLENQVLGAIARGGSHGPAPVAYLPTGTGLIDPEWRWEREHPFRR